VAWALDLLGLANGHMPSKREVQKRYRELLRVAHPDHGGADEAAAERIADLGEARRILLG
jgi:curved DNA-binding protein CbpA